MIRMTRLQMNLVAKVLTAQDGAAFVNRMHTDAPRSGEDYRAGFTLIQDAKGINVLSTLPSGYEVRSTHLEAYASALDEAGYRVETKWRGARCTAVKVVS